MADLSELLAAASTTSSFQDDGEDEEFEAYDDDDDDEDEEFEAYDEEFLGAAFNALTAPITAPVNAIGSLLGGKPKKSSPKRAPRRVSYNTRGKRGFMNIGRYKIPLNRRFVTPSQLKTAIARVDKARRIGDSRLRSALSRETKYRIREDKIIESAKLEAKLKDTESKLNSQLQTMLLLSFIQDEEPPQITTINITDPTSGEDVDVKVNSNKYAEGEDDNLGMLLLLSGGLGGSGGLFGSGAGGMSPLVLLALSGSL